MFLPSYNLFFASGNPALKLVKKITIVYKTIPNVQKNLLSLDIYPIKIGKNQPVIIWVHGGGWMLGDKNNQIDNKIKLFQKLGYILVSVNYRLSPNPMKISDPNRIKYPEHLKDIANAVNWIYKNIQKYNGDNKKMVIMGHSAGAQLVALLACDPEFLNAHNLKTDIFKAVISLDTRGYNIKESIDNSGKRLKQMYINGFGNDEKIWEKASAVNYLDTNKYLPKNWIIAERGKKDRVQAEDNFAMELKNKGLNIMIIHARQLSHREVNAHIGLEGDKIITPVIVDFLKKCFNDKAK